MTRLRLVEAPEPIFSEVDASSVMQLPPGRHGIPSDLVRAHQRGRLIEAATEALAEQGYGRVTAARVTELAGVSSRTFYEHFEDLWACLLAAYEVEAARLCQEIEGACAAADGERRERARSGIAAGLAFLSSEPAPARLLSAEPPPQVAPLATARLDLVERLSALLRNALEPGGATPLPGLERRLIGAALALVSTRAVAGEAERLRELEPELSELLLASL